MDFHQINVCLLICLIVLFLFFCFFFSVLFSGSKDKGIKFSKPRIVSVSDLFLASCQKPHVLRCL